MIVSYAGVMIGVAMKMFNKAIRNWKHARRIRTLRNLLAESNSKLGNRTRRHFDHAESRKHLYVFLKIALIVCTTLIMVGILYYPVKTIITGLFVTHQMDLLKTGALTLMTLVFGAIFFIIYRKEFHINIDSYFVATRGVIGQVIESLKRRITFPGMNDFYPYASFDDFYHSFPFADFDKYEGLDYWSDSELGRFMKLAIAYLFIYASNDYGPFNEDVRKFLKDSNASGIVNEIMDDVNERKERRDNEAKTIRKNRERKEKERRAAIVDEMTRAVVEPKPDHTDPDLARINDQAKVLKDKASELVARSDGIPQLP